MESSEEIVKLNELLERHNELLARQLANDRNWKLKFVNSVLTGFGGFLGATLVVSLAVYLLQPFQDLKGLKPALERLAQQKKR